MGLWLRVFGSASVQPQPAALLEHLHGLGYQVGGDFRGDDHGWFQAELQFDDTAAPLQLDCFQAREDDLRNELNAWAAWLETLDDGPNHGRLMQQVISTTQLYTLELPETELNEERGMAICRFLARATDGIYQVDDHGFFDREGDLLVAEVGHGHT
jgi:hypothetical protein